MELLIFALPFVLLGAVLALPAALVAAVLVKVVPTRIRTFAQGLAAVVISLPGICVHFWIRSLGDVDGPGGFGLTIIWIIAWSVSVFGLAFYVAGTVEGRQRNKRTISTKRQGYKVELAMTRSTVGGS